MKNITIGLLVICMLAMCSAVVFANDTTVFSEDFKDSAAAMKKLNLYSAMWKVSDGVLHSKNKIDQSATFSFGDANWKDYEVEFKIKRLEANPKDQHFSIYVRQEDTLNKGTFGLRLYCSGRSVRSLEIVDKKTIRNDLVGYLPKPMEVGDKSSWSAFKIVVSGSTATVYVDGALIGKVENLIPAKGMLAFYAYRVKVDLSDLKVKVLSTSVPS